MDFDSSDQRNGYKRDAESSQGNKKHCAFCGEVVVCTTNNSPICISADDPTLL